MKKDTKYSCSHCKKEFKKEMHIGVQFSGLTSIEIIPPKSFGWEVKRINIGYHRFCNSMCLKRFFDVMVKETKQQIKDENMKKTI